MEARLLRAAFLVAALLSLGASHQSANFMVTAPTPELAREICEQAEVFRRDLAIEWLGHELPPWQGRCPIRAEVSPNLGAGGETSFMFSRGRPHNWRMIIQGSRERILDSVLPHEVTHTIFATHFGQPLPRWADEGACTTVEAASERAKQDRMLIQFLTTKPSRGIAFNRMFAMREYPADIMPLYSQGYSVTRFLIAQGGQRQFIDYVGEGLETNDWTSATAKYYDFDTLSELQLTWLEWVRQGSPQLTPELLASLRGGQAPATEAPAGQPSAAAVASTENGSGSWYSSHRDDMPPSESDPAATPQTSLVSASQVQSGANLDWGDNGAMVPINQATRPQDPQGVQATVLEETSSGGGQPAAPSSPRSAEAWEPGSIRYDGSADAGVIRR